MRTLRTAALSGLLLALLAVSTGCKKEPSRWDEAAASATVAAPASPRVEGAKLNAFFPADGASGYSRVFTQEKDGFVEARLKKDGQDVATLSIADASGDAAARAKFDKATDKIGDSPLVAVGKNQSALLVAGKYQVKVSSPTLDEAARKEILGKFDLAGLSKL